MRRILVSSVALMFCFGGLAMAAGKESAKDFMQLHKIEIDWHTAQTTKNINLMMSLFTNDATFVGRGKTYTGKAQIKKLLMANPAFNPKNLFVAYTPPSRFKSDIEGDRGHVSFECIQLNQATNKIVPHSHVRLTADVVRVNGHWLIKRAKGAREAKL